MNESVGLNSLVDYFNVKIHDIWEGNVTTWREIQIEQIHSLGLWDIREERDITEDDITEVRVYCMYN